MTIDEPQQDDDPEVPVDGADAPAAAPQNRAQRRAAGKKN